MPIDGRLEAVSIEAMDLYALTYLHRNNCRVAVGTTVPPPPMRGEERPLFLPMKIKNFLLFRYASSRSK